MFLPLPSNLATSRTEEPVPLMFEFRLGYELPGPYGPLAVFGRFELNKPKRDSPTVILLKFGKPAMGRVCGPPYCG